MVISPAFTGVPKKRSLYLGVVAWGKQRNRSMIRSPGGTVFFYGHTGKAEGLPIAPWNRRNNGDVSSSC